MTGPALAPGRRDMLEHVIGAILPPAVAAEEAFGDDPAARLFPDEAAAVARAVDTRRREFTTGRACARAALARLGLPAAPIPRGERGAPQWPSGVVGSITHCAGYRACAVAHRRDVVTIGLDAEPHGPLPDGVLNVVARPEEQDQLARLAAIRPAVHWDRLLFSAKESVYKAWFPLTGQWLGFSDASLEFSPAGDQFTARILLDATPIEFFEGRWLVDHGLVATAIAVEA
ncbi:MAG TPA: 4'-phosphopantetheinyl transferase superfamily protein [Streptosporangiaceae bacterium]